MDETGNLEGFKNLNSRSDETKHIDINLDPKEISRYLYCCWHLVYFTLLISETEEPQRSTENSGNLCYIYTISDDEIGR